jgi:two-component system sensor histidine kinase BaeS
LRARLVVAFVGVAVLAIVTFAALLIVASRSEVDDLVQRQQEATRRDVAAALADAYREAGTWEAADLRPAAAVAVAGGAVLDVRDAHGAEVVSPPAGLWPGPSSPRAMGPARSLPVVVAGERVGTGLIRFPAGAQRAPERELRDALAHTTVVGVAIATGVAILAAALVSHAITRPLRRLTAAARELESGDRSARVKIDAAGELGELGRAFDRMAASLEREDELRRSLVADIAHELRTPVTVLQAETEAMLDGIHPADDRGLGHLHDEAVRLGQVVGDLEALAAAQAASLRLELRSLDLAEVVRDAVKTLAPGFAESGVRLETSLESVRVVGDEARLFQTTRNLLSNALKFTPPGGLVSVGVAARRGDALIVVRDTGTGIPADEIPHVFERFWRGRGARTTTGSGIGLAVVAELVRAHGGRVEVGSSPGQGSVFTVILPGA